MTVAVIVVLLGFASLTIDVGYLYGVRLDLQNTVDAAALAGASALGQGEEAVIDRATAMAAKHNVDGNGLKLDRGDVVVGYWDAENAQFTRMEDDDTRPPDAVHVVGDLSAARGSAVSLFFAPILGHDQSDVNASATATFGTGQTWDVMIVQDISGSFTDALPNAKRADESLLGCLKDHTNNASRVGLVTYSGTARLNFAMEAIEDEFDNLIDVIKELSGCCWLFCADRPKCVTGTNIAAGIDLALEQFDNIGAPDPGAGQAIVLVTDGKPQGAKTAYSDDELEGMAVEAADRAWERGISVYAVYYAGDSKTAKADVEFLKSLIRGEGTFQATPDADRLSDLVWSVCSSLPLMLVE